MPRLTARESKELLKHTPMKTQHGSEERERENAHRALPQDEQPYMIVFFGMLDYGVLWIGEPGGSKEVAEAEMTWWQDQIRNGLEVLPFTRNPSVYDVQVRQQWDLDSLAEAIQDGYR